MTLDGGWSSVVGPLVLVAATDDERCMDVCIALMDDRQVTWRLLPRWVVK